jgi:hypothetical protein
LKAEVHVLVCRRAISEGGVVLYQRTGINVGVQSEGGSGRVHDEHGVVESRDGDVLISIDKILRDRESERGIDRDAFSFPESSHAADIIIDLPMTFGSGVHGVSPDPVASEDEAPIILRQSEDRVRWVTGGVGFPLLRFDDEEEGNLVAVEKVHGHVVDL